MTKLLRAAGLFAAFMLAGAALLAPSAGATQGQPTQALPFQATVVGATTSIDFAGGPDAMFGGRCSVPSSWLISFAGTGHATHLGTFTWTSSHCTQFDPVSMSVAITDGEMEYVAANGDGLFFDYGNAVFSPQSPTLMCMTDVAVMTGGTGRFDGASGSTLEKMCFDPTGGPVLTDMHLTSQGTIVYDASNRAG